MRTPLALLAALAISCFSFVARAAMPLPDGFKPPAGYTVVETTAKVFDYDHESIAYEVVGQKDYEIDPAGKTWRFFLKIDPPQKKVDEVNATMRKALKAQGWTVLTPETGNGTMVAKRSSGGKDEWFKGNAGTADFRAVVLLTSDVPHPLTLKEPTTTPETYGDADDFPFLQHLVGSTLEKTQVLPGGAFSVTPEGSKLEVLAGPPSVSKTYKLPASYAPLELVTTYKAALEKAGWTIIRTAVGSDGLVVAHYTKNGRDLYAYLHDGNFQIADVGAQNEAKALADALDKDGHVAIYGIYFDIDLATIKAESETALNHILELLKKNPKLKLQVQGHTDDSGTAEHNQKLSDDRALSVKKWLVDKGIAATRLTTKGFGATKPVADNKTPEGRSKNRRVELAK